MAVIPVVTPAEARERADSVVLLDVRELDEWTLGHVDGSVHIPLRELPARLPELAPDRPIVAICRVGGRSAHAAAFLNRHGYQAANLDGGLEAWVDADLPLVTDDGERGTVE
jgi:rhodanese-related sulfurtransferase